jgi:hypothetical protein
MPIEAERAAVARIKPPRGRERVISKEPRQVPTIESVPWKVTTPFGEEKIISLARVRFLEGKPDVQ